jgi:hypothetical protein
MGEETNELAVQDPKHLASLTKEALKKLPTEIVEEELVDFVKYAFDIVKQNNDFYQEINDSLLADMKAGTLTPAQKIALLTNASVNQNDLTSKLLSPLSQIITSRQQVEMAKANAVAAVGEAAMGASNMKDMSLAVSPQILNGLKAFNDLMTKMSSMDPNKQILPPAKDEPA